MLKWFLSLIEHIILNIYNSLRTYFKYICFNKNPKDLHQDTTEAIE